MITLEEIIKKYESKTTFLTQKEQEVSDKFKSSQYRGIFIIFDIFLSAFTDNLTSICKPISKKDVLLLLYSESFKRIRIAIDLSKKGYYTEALASLRTSFELNKILNAIQKDILPELDFFGKDRGDEFKSLTKKEQGKIILSHQKEIDLKINNFDDKDLPPNIRPTLKIFKSNFHVSVHKALSSIALKFSEFTATGQVDLFGPDSASNIVEISINYTSYMILIYLKLWTKSRFYDSSKTNVVTDLENFLQNSYSISGTEFSKDIIEYINIKYA
ncbi:hypothetical protein EHO58_01500 [Leptospira selangorensis]|uniref:hypothetical protein n=1 Tax=Leptospira selangorensis TaxID=2484982 RepID=UPI0010840C4F|nr:hypothetical protein [Leptospira selangorensis]TGK10126.1 hypothetical protein EHO58_01500 [Leptospira selangorensis]